MGEEIVKYKLISDSYRFGYGIVEYNDTKRYLAFHGQSDRNEDFYTVTEISKEEYENINKEYPSKVSSDRKGSDLFRNKYIVKKKVIYEGWNLPKTV